MASVETRLISKIINTRNIKKAFELGVKSSFFYGSQRDVWKYLVHCFEEHGVVPSRERIERRFPDFEVEKTKTELYAPLVEDLKEREHYNALRETLEEAAKCLPDSTERAHETMLRGLERASELSAEHKFPNPLSVNGWVGGALTPISLGTIEEPPPQEGLLGGRIAKGHATTLYGDGGQGKSYLALAIASSIAGGKLFLGFPMPKGRVLYLDWELSLEAQTQRAFKIARGMGLMCPPKRLLYLAAPQSLPKMIARIRRLVQSEQLACVVIDSFGPACGGNPEAADSVMPLFTELRSLGVTVLLIDHQAKMQEGQSYSKKTPFGSAFKFNLSRSVLQLERVASSDGELKVILTQTKNNLGGPKSKLGINICFERQDTNSESVSFTQADTKTDPAFSSHLHAEDKILCALRDYGPSTKVEISERTGVPVKTVENSLPKMLKTSKVIETGKKKGRKTIWSVPNTPSAQTYSHRDKGDSTSKRGLVIKLRKRSKQ